MRCFVIMPFGDPSVDPVAARKSDSIYTNWIKRAVESIADPDAPGGQIQCSRADRNHQMRDIIEHIVEALVEADIVIADLTGRNANVFYELGVRHATSVNTILIAESEHEIPFDLRRMRTFFYRYEPNAMLDLQNNIRLAISEIIRDRDRIDNPVRRYLYERETRKIMQSSSPHGIR